MSACIIFCLDTLAVFSVVLSQFHQQFEVMGGFGEDHFQRIACVLASW